jgi:uncharacterized protein (TIGR02217 family)
MPLSTAGSSVDFDDEEISRDYTEVAVGGPVFDTGILGNRFSVQQRAIRRQDAIRTWEIQFDGLSEVQKANLEEFFITKYGGGVGFLFYPPTDNTFFGDVQPYLTDGVSTDYPLYRAYSCASRTVYRRIAKINEFISPQVLVGGIPYFWLTQFFLLPGNGMISFFFPPPAGLEIWISSGQILTPVYFEVDDMDAVDYGVFSEMSSVKLVEILPGALGIE